MLDKECSTAPIADHKDVVVEGKELPAKYEFRPPAPEDVWNYRDYSSWRGIIWSLIEDFATPEVRRYFLVHPPEYVVGDDLGWLDEIVDIVRNESIDSKSLLSCRLRKHFRAIRAVHGTKTSDVTRFYREGLRPLNPEEFHVRARELFLGGRFPELDESCLQQAIRKVGSALREGRVYFEANEEMLVGDCGHYLVYGSEYLTALAAQIGVDRDYRQALTSDGRPVVLICDVPLDLVSEATLSEFAGESLERVFQELLDGKKPEHSFLRGAGFCIRATLHPSCIAGHYHPAHVHDPLTNCVHHYA